MTADMDTEPCKPEWVDPWLKAQAARERPYEGPAAEGALTRRDCAILGAKIFVTGVGAPCAITVIMAAPAVLQHAFDNLMVRELMYLYASIPPAVVVGGAMGFLYYRMFTGPLAALQRNNSSLVQFLGCLGWIAVGLFLHVFALILFATLRSRRNTIADMVPGWGVLVSFCMLISFILLIGLTTATKTKDIIGVQTACSVLALFTCDAHLINRMITMRKANRLAVPETRKFQFSLRTMLLFVWGVGAWITGLVIMART